MILSFRKITYKLNKENFSKANKNLRTHLHPIYLKNNASLLFRWNNLSSNELFEIWHFKKNNYSFIHDAINVYLENSNLGFLKRIYTDRESSVITKLEGELPRNIVSVFGFITNNKNEILIVKTNWRSDTWELPGGLVEYQEPIDKALIREIQEETGVKVKLEGITGVYSNVDLGTISIGFRGYSIGGSIATSEETRYVKFMDLNTIYKKNYIKRNSFKIRFQDALEGNIIRFNQI